MHNNSDCHILNASLDAILMNFSLKYLIDVGIFNFPVHRQPITIACFFRGPSSIILAFTWTLFSIFDSLLRLLISLRSFPSLRPRLSEENNDPDLTSLKPLRTPRRLWRWAGPDKEQYDTGTWEFPQTSNLSEDIREVVRNPESSPDGPARRCGDVELTEVWWGLT